MAICDSGRPFLESQRPGHIPEPALTHWDRLGVDLDERESSQLRVVTSAVEGWWFNLLEGKGRVKVRAEALRSSNYDLLIFTIRGGYQGCGQPLPAHVPLPGEIMLSRWEHAGDLICTREFSLLCACIPPGFLSKLAYGEIPYGRPVSVHRGGGAVLSASFSALVAEAMSHEGSASLGALLPNFTRLALTALAAAPAQDEQAGTQVSYRVVQYVEAHLSDPNLSPAAVSHECALSVRHLHRLFARRNQTFATHLRNRRLELAARLLMSPSPVSISEVAYHCGFSSPTVFCRLFRNAYGASPREFRDQAKTGARTTRPN